jgi:ORF6N domain
MPKNQAASLPARRIERAIIIMRDQRVMLDEDLAMLYGVETRTLVQSVKRNLERFPLDFMFQLTKEEMDVLRSQQLIASKRNIRHLPFAFTEQGVAMLSSVLRSPRAVDVNIEIMRAFVRLRHWAASNAELARRIDELEKKYDGQFTSIFDALRQLMAPPTEDAPREMGYHTLVRRPGDKPASSRRRSK